MIRLPYYLPVLSSLILAVSPVCIAQSVQRDTLQAALVTADRARTIGGSRLIKPQELRGVISVTGESDPVKFIQTLPGVSTGAEGSSSFYARGGNFGNNVLTLDGVPVYGSSHLLGFGSVIPMDVVEKSEFQIGGFSSGQGNLTASHIMLQTQDDIPVKGTGVVSASNFLLSGSASVPLVEDKLSLSGSIRMSPMGWEISALKGLSNAMSGLDDIKALVYDAFGKLSWKIKPSHYLSASVFRTMDSYGYRLGSDADDRMRWSNLIAQLAHNASLDNGLLLSSSVSYNDFTSYQAVSRTLGEEANDLAVQNGLREWTIHSTLKRVSSLQSGWQTGIKARYARFSPGSSCYYSGGIVKPLPTPIDPDLCGSLMATLHGQWETGSEDRFLLRVGGRLNLFYSWRDKDYYREKLRFDPEASLLIRYRMRDGLGLETTIDRVVQYYHLLEGIPLGWSLDMTVPSSGVLPPERALQGYSGLFWERGIHRVSSGVYYKDMSGLTYFADAVKIFNSAAAGWRSNVKVGNGLSYGLETQYEAHGDRLDFRIAYTLSKTDRRFSDINRGRPFPAKFDRRHIFNLSADYLISKTPDREWGCNSFFTFQSGHWETVPEGWFPGTLPADDGTVSVHYFDRLNNWEMPPYIRWDLGIYFRRGLRSRYPRQLNLGFFNVLNRHNPYSITYDPSDRKWKQLSLFPIMPSLKYSLEF